MTLICDWPRALPIYDVASNESKRQAIQTVSRHVVPPGPPPVVNSGCYRRRAPLRWAPNTLQTVWITAGRHEPSVLSGRRSWRTWSRESGRRKTRRLGRRRHRRSCRCELRVRAGLRCSFLRSDAPRGRPARAALGAHGAVRVSGVFRLRPAAHPAVSGRTPGLQPVPPQAELLPDLPGPP